MPGSTDNKIRPRVSVAMPVHNAGRANLQVSIGSVLAQTMPQIELICVDDASTDCSAKALDEFASRDPRVHVISFPYNRGTLDARTAAIIASTGDYVVPLDPDDHLDADACCRLCKAMDDSDWTMAQFGMRLFAENGNRTDAKKREEFEHWFSPHVRSECSFTSFAHDTFIGRSRCWTMAAKIFKRDALVSALRTMPQGYCVNGEDGLALLAFLESGDGRVGVLTDKLYNYRWGYGISTTASFNEARMSGMIRSAIFANRFLESRDSECANAYRRLLMKNMVSDIVYRCRPAVMRRTAVTSLAKGVSRPALECAFHDLGISHRFFNRCGLVFRTALARTLDRRRKLRRRLALARRIASLEKTARRSQRSNNQSKDGAA